MKKKIPKESPNSFLPLVLLFLKNYFLLFLSVQSYDFLLDCTHNFNAASLPIGGK